MNKSWRIYASAILRPVRDSCRDLLPVVVVIGFFQAVILARPLPEGVTLTDLAFGVVFVVLGLSMFVTGLRLGLFPMGERLSQALVQRKYGPWLFAFAFSLGFGATIAEPALLAVAEKAANVMAAGGALAADAQSQARFALSLRIVVALSVGVAISLGVLRLLKGWPLHLIIIGGYGIALALTLVAPQAIIGIAYDSGGVTTSTITVPLVTALGVGLATVVRGRSPLLDGFGLIALASVMPIIFVLIFGIVRFG